MFAGTSEPLLGAEEGSSDQQAQRRASSTFWTGVTTAVIAGTLGGKQDVHRMSTALAQLLNTNCVCQLAARGSFWSVVLRPGQRSEKDFS